LSGSTKRGDKGYARVFVKEPGKIKKVLEVYHPDPCTEDFAREYVNECDEIEHNFEDAEVLIVFHFHSYLSGAPWDGQEWETDLITDHETVLQYGYKEHWAQQIREEIEGRYGVPIDMQADLNDMSVEDYVKNLKAEWEEVYDEDFPEEKPKPKVITGIEGLFDGESDD
jgi:hypothetical protein